MRIVAFVLEKVVDSVKRTENRSREGGVEGSHNCGTDGLSFDCQSKLISKLGSTTGYGGLPIYSTV